MLGSRIMVVLTKMVGELTIALAFAALLGILLTDFHYFTVPAAHSTGAKSCSKTKPSYKSIS